MPKTHIHRKTTTIGLYLLDTLYAHGVDQIFGIPGDYVLKFDKLIETHEIQFINTTRENTAGLMADTFGRIKGLGVACITYGVGINITNAVAQAHAESSPLVIISGAAGTGEYARSQKLHHLFNRNFSSARDPTQLDIFAKITAAQAILDNPRQAPSEINRVLEICYQQKKPVYIEIPRDQVDHEIPAHQPHRLSLPKSDPETLKEVLEETKAILKQSKQAVIWAGHEIQRFDLADQLTQFAEKFNIPIATSLLGKTVVSEYDPLFIGVYQGKLSREEVRSYVEGSDCALVLGVILSDVDTGLFTANIDPSKQIFASAEAVRIKHHEYKNVYFHDFVQGLAKLDSNVRFRGAYPSRIDSPPELFVPKKGKKITTERLFQCIQKHLKPNHILVSDMGDSLFGSSDLIMDKNCYISNGYFGSIGFGVPGALGAQIASPEKRVIAIVGDGAFQITCMELSTAVRYGLDPIIILLNNHGYGTERPLLEGKYNDIVNWRYSEIPRVIGGGIGFHPGTEEMLDKTLSKALSTRGQFYLIEVEVGKTDFSPMLKRFCNIVNGR